MTDLRSPRLIIAKGFLFLVLGLLAFGLLLWMVPRLDIAVLLVIAIWAFCRFYYFAFYVIEHYVDPGYRFAGLSDFARYLVRRWQTDRANNSLGEDFERRQNHDR